jgi:hypothetical protein
MTQTMTCVSAGGVRLALDMGHLLDDTGREVVAEQTYQWIKSLRAVRFGDMTFRDRFRYRDDSLWWFTEVYLHKTRQLERAIRTVATLDAAVRQHAPQSIEIEAAGFAERIAALAFGAARGVPVSVFGADTRPSASHWPSYRIGLEAALTRWRSSPASRRPSRARVAAFIHNAFWRGSASAAPKDESYIGPVLEALERRAERGDVAYVGVGPRRNFRARRWWDPVVARPGNHDVVPIEQFSSRRALGGALGLWRARHSLAAEVTSSPGVRAAGEVLGVDLWPLLERELEDVARLQWPWSARAMDEAGAALDALEPAVAVTYAEAGGWGRALVLEARRRAVPCVGIQHGFIYRHWLNYRHEPDEMAGADRGFPCPDRTLLFDGYTGKHLEEAGHLPATSLRVTGNPRLDVLIPRFRTARSRDRAARRAELGASDRESVAILAAKFSEVSDDLPELFRAAASRPSTRLIVKTHPAETEGPYRELAAGLDNISVVPAGHDLADLLAAADVVVTKNSTVAIDALLLDLPALVVGLPNNLTPFVDAGVMLGGRRGKIREALDAVLYDRTVRDRLIDAARRFVLAEALAADGHAAERAAHEILALTP